MTLIIELHCQDVEVLEKSEASDLVRSVRAGLALQLRTALPVKDIRRQLIAAHRRAYEKLRKLQNVLFLNEELWDGSIVSAFFVHSFSCSRHA